jgi:ferrochelatase
MKRAVVLLNLGAPDRPAAVEPFLANLFNDPAIIRLPWPLRPVLARLIAKRRGPKARAIYAAIGGGSPLRAETEAQAQALEQALAGERDQWRVFVAMRYWHPMSEETARAVAAYAPDRVLLLPLYPQFSTTTTASSFRAWTRAAEGCGLTAPTQRICCYPTDPAWIAAQAEATRAAMTGLEGGLRILFSAHGLPERVVAAGDPYQWQVEQTAAAVAACLPVEGRDWVVCYQSKVGPLRWIGPSTESEIARAGRDRVAVVIVPISFVSEHSETLVELDITYRALAEKAGVPAYRRTRTVGTAPGFIGALRQLVVRTVAANATITAGEGNRACPAALIACVNVARS